MARDVKEHAEDLDGLAKNVDKLKKEAKKMAEAVKNSGDSHDPIMNAATEAARVSPYGFAHVAMIGGLILVAIIIGLVAFG